MPISIGLVIPCYNEEEIISHTYNELDKYLKELAERGVISEKSQICFVDDGSYDGTWDLIEKIASNPNACGIKLSTNFGHQGALLAGLLNNIDKFDCIISMDADLQDDVQVVEKMIAAYQDGNSIVYGVRSSRETDTIFKRFTAKLFYRLMESLKVNTIYNHADYRLISNNVLKALLEFKEVNLFLRGIFPLMGFKTSVVKYKRAKRMYGDTKYPMRKMIAFAWEGITSFTAYPMRLILFLGCILFIVSIAAGLWAARGIFNGNTVQGWASTIILLVFFGGLQMICLGLIGEYIGKIYKEVKQRPRFIIEKSTND